MKDKECKLHEDWDSIYLLSKQALNIIVLGKTQIFVKEINSLGGKHWK